VENADGSLYASLGGSGGSRIFGAVAQTLINLIDCGMDIEKAIDRPRLHNQLLPNFTTIEVGPKGEDMKLRRGLEKRGHIIKPFDINVSAADGELDRVGRGR
jgi:gamma-glutamyltranspeptidase/glutathione hydrolase/leukotriene-C4 hydrolase